MKPNQTQTTPAYEKLDATLNRLVREGTQTPRPVFVLLNGEVGPNETAVLATYGVRVGASRGPLTGSLSPSGVASLSHEPWVRAIRAAGTRNPL